MGIKKEFHVETVLELRTEECLGKEKESLRGKNSQSCDIQELKERQCDRTFESLGDLTVKSD